MSKESKHHADKYGGKRNVKDMRKWDHVMYESADDRQRCRQRKDPVLSGNRAPGDHMFIYPADKDHGYGGIRDDPQHAFVYKKRQQRTVRVYKPAVIKDLIKILS